jgi:hypothetical protein
MTEKKMYNLNEVNYQLQFFILRLTIEASQNLRNEMGIKDCK